MMTDGTGYAVPGERPVFLKLVLPGIRPLRHHIETKRFSERHSVRRSDSEQTAAVIRILTGSINSQLTLSHHSVAVKASVLHAGRVLRQAVPFTLELREKDRVAARKHHGRRPPFAVLGKIYELRLAVYVLPEVHTGQRGVQVSGVMASDTLVRRDELPGAGRIRNNVVVGLCGETK